MACSPIRAEENGKPHWSYKGANGPAAWARISSDFRTCASGQQQSPVDIRQAYASVLGTLDFQYAPSQTDVINNGHTIQFNYDAGSYLVIGADRYQLLQFHFHTPSEEALAGERLPMVVHLVHKNEAGQLAVVAVLIEEGPKDNPLIAKLWPLLPTKAGSSKAQADLRYSIAQLLPDNHAYWTLMGSLTTPPCTEGVRWFILKTPVELSHRQIMRFRQLYPMNARPLQPLHKRAVLGS